MTTKSAKEIEFILCQGTHVTGTGENKKVYKFNPRQKTIIRSAEPLDQMFNKPGSIRFKRVDGQTILPGLNSEA